MASRNPYGNQSRETGDMIAALAQSGILFLWDEWLAEAERGEETVPTPALVSMFWEWVEENRYGVKLVDNQDRALLRAVNDMLKRKGVIT